jgi:hypothetical protein
MTVQILENFISNEDANFIVKNFSKNLLPIKDRPGFFEDMFRRNPTPFDEKKLDPNNNFKTVEESTSSALINNAMYLAILEIEKFYNIKVNKCVGGMTKLISGAFHGPHADVCDIDGTKIDNDPDAEFLQYSGLIYLSECDKDFSGGALKFPQHGLELKPKTGMFVFFEGNEKHIHEVTEIVSGERHAIVMFFGI